MKPWIAAALLVSLLSGPAARATPPAAPAPASAAQVAAGESPDLNLRTSPVGLFFAVLNANLDVRVAEAVTLGVAFAYFRGNTAATTSDYYQYGLIGTYFPAGPCFTNGPYVRLGGFVLPDHASRTSGGTVFTGTTNSYAGALTGGYQWIWGGHFNVELGAGFGYFSHSRAIAGTSQDGVTLTFNSAIAGGWQPSLEASLGYAF